MKVTVLPVLLGGDLNCYHMARSFHEAYQIRSQVFGRYPLQETSRTAILDFTCVPDLDKEEVLLKTLRDFAKATPDCRRIVIGCTDDYAMLLSRLREELLSDYIVPYTHYEQMRTLTNKVRFAALCRQYQLATPHTVVRQKGARLGALPFSYPIIIKPASSADYWHHPFPEMQKVYLAKNPIEAEKILASFDAAGYEGDTLLQEFIYGDDTQMYVLNAYSDQNARVRSMCLGRVLCEEHTPRGRGNPAAILTVRCDELCEKIRNLLEKEKFVGFSNFDIKRDAQSGIFYVLEMNARQGRSAYYVTAAGQNLAVSLVEDYIENKPYRGCSIAKREIYWRYLPDPIVRAHTTPSLFAACRRAKRNHHAYSSLHYPPDLRRNPYRRAWLLAHEAKYFLKYHRHRSLAECAEDFSCLQKEIKTKKHST
jgi:D-aspartate ligase